MNMANWKRSLIESGQVSALSIMTYSGLELTGLRVIDVVTSGRSQASVVEALADRYRSAAAALTFMDLSVEAEAFGTDVLFFDYEIPTVVGKLVAGVAAASALEVPAVGTKRTADYIEGMQRVVRAVTDRPVFDGCIGPFSLAGRLLDVNEALMMTRGDPDLLHAVLEKCTAFLIDYARAIRNTGVSGILMAEPLAGLLSPVACDHFSSGYIRPVVEAVQGETFAFVLHNCGNTTRLVKSMVATGADALHFGNAVRMADNITQVPGDVLVCGNLDPAAIFGLGTEDQLDEATTHLLADMRGWPNFVLSSGCNIPPQSPIANLDRFFAALSRFNGKS